MRILVDMDDTIVDMTPTWYDIYNRENNFNLTRESVKSWDTHKYVPTGKAIFEILKRPGFFRHLPAIPGALEAVEELMRDGHQVYLVTAAFSEAASDKMLWVEQYMPWFPMKNIVVTHSKYLLRADVLIDDGPHNIIEFRESNPRAYIATIEYEYNKVARDSADLMVPGHKDFLGAWSKILECVRKYAPTLTRG